MKARPILFSTPMVLALLEGRKTQTRRIIKPQPIVKENNWQFYPKSPFSRAGVNIPLNISDMSPYGKVGDLLWVRETASFWIKDGKPEKIMNYRADYIPNIEEINAPRWEKQEWRPSIHMPRWASRLTLEITAVRVERLLDITQRDAVAEGIKPLQGNAIRGFCDLWKSINGESSWATNPWVWVIEFKVHHENVDSLTTLSER